MFDTDDAARLVSDETQLWFQTQTDMLIKKQWQYWQFWWKCNKYWWTDEGAATWRF